MNVIKIGADVKENCLFSIIWKRDIVEAFTANPVLLTPEQQIVDIH